MEDSLGWGFQLQEPLFVLVLAIILFVFALSLSGVLDIGNSLTGIGSKISRADGYTGSFFSGILATVVSTPCMAPFLGVAVGTALTMDWLGAYAVFTVLHLDSLYHICCYRFFQLGFLNYPNLENGWRHLSNSWHFPCMQPSSGCSGHYKASCNQTRRFCEKKSLNRKKISL